MNRICNICHQPFETESPYVLICGDNCRSVSCRESREKYKKTPAGVETQKRYKSSPTREKSEAKYRSTENAKRLASIRTQKNYAKKKDDPMFLQVKRERDSQYKAKNRDEYLAKRRVRYNTVLKKDLGYMLNKRMHQGIRKCLKNNKNGKWLNLVEYSVDQLHSRLEDTMPVGFDWDDFMNGGLHIDHIYPMSRFDIQSSESKDFRECWALTNLQLLPARENIIKSNKVLI